MTVLWALSAIIPAGLLAVWLEAVHGFGEGRAMATAIAPVLAFGALVRPHWFWENWKAQALRGLIGDRAAAAVYLAVATVLAYAAVTGPAWIEP